MIEQEFDFNAIWKITLGSATVPERPPWLIPAPGTAKRLSQKLLFWLTAEVTEDAQRTQSFDNQRYISLFPLSILCYLSGLNTFETASCFWIPMD
jgi:hypothetical protein